MYSMSQTGFRGNSGILLQHLFIQKPCKAAFTRATFLERDSKIFYA